MSVFDLHITQVVKSWITANTGESLLHTYRAERTMTATSPASTQINSPSFHRFSLRSRL